MGRNSFPKVGPAATLVLMGFFGRREAKAPTPTPMPARRVVIEGPTPPPVPPPPKPRPRNPLEEGILFRDLHPDLDPAPSVRTATMTCPSCSATFRYFLNSDGKKTIVGCPGCAKQYRL